ncbi:MAG TPA: proton-conducting transporter membrane subunit [Candidatus Limnocylindrales bacterium]|nr:proton-conducting transporter membrane subunit [Candidatus Limnocylindrales bacterium]
MNLLALILVPLLGGLANVLLMPLQRTLATSIGLGTALLTALLALGVTSNDAVALGGQALVGSNLVRVVALGWSLGTLALGLMEVEIGRRRVVTGPALLALAVGVLALAIDDATTSFAALAAGGVGAIVVPSLAGWVHGREDPWRLRTAIRGSWAVIGSSLLAIVVVAWAASPAGPLRDGPPIGDPAARAAAGLALLGIVAAVAIRTGLIPAHVWAARFIEGVSPLAVPAALVWGSGVFLLVALGWGQVAVGPGTQGDLERVAITLVGVASILLGGLAATLHDDVEHVLGYSILQDMGLAVLAFASLHTEAADAARNWLIASAMLKTALAAWVAAARSTFGVHRLVDLRGWVSGSPPLAVGLGLIALGAVGLPGMAIFSARLDLVGGVLTGPLGTLVVLAALTPILYLGRIVVVGLGRPGPAVMGAASPRPRWTGGRAAGWSSGSVRSIARAIPAELRANRAPLIALGVLVLAAIGFGVAVGGAAA